MCISYKVANYRDPLPVHCYLVKDQQTWILAGQTKFLPSLRSLCAPHPNPATKSLLLPCYSQSHPNGTVDKEVLVDVMELGENVEELEHTALRGHVLVVLELCQNKVAQRLLTGCLQQTSLEELLKTNLFPKDKP